MKFFLPLALIILIAAVGCETTATPNIQATVDAAVANALASATSTPANASKPTERPSTRPAERPPTPTAYSKIPLGMAVVKIGQNVYELEDAQLAFQGYWTDGSRTHWELKSIYAWLEDGIKIKIPASEVRIIEFLSAPLKMPELGSFRFDELGTTSGNRAEYNNWVRKAYITTSDNESIMVYLFVRGPNYGLEIQGVKGLTEIGLRLSDIKVVTGYIRR